MGQECVQPLLAMAPHQMRLCFITAGPESKMRQAGGWISSGPSLQLLQTGLGRMLWNPCGQTPSPWTMPSPTRSAAISCYQRQKKKTHNFFFYTLVVPLSPALLKSSSTFSVWPIYYSTILPSAGSAAQGLQGSRGLKVSLEERLPVLSTVHGSGSVIHPLPPPPATLGSFSSRTHPLGMSGWEPEVSEIFLNLLSQL